MAQRILSLAMICMASLVMPERGWSFERTIGGMTVGRAFPEPQVAELAKAACNGDAGKVARLAAGGVNPNAEGDSGAVPLLWAVRCHSVRGVNALLETGADPNHVMDGDFSPVYAAAQEPFPILRSLLANGGDPNAGSIESKRSALIEAMSKGINGGGWSNYYLLLSAGADINRTYGATYTIATFASDMAQYEKLGELLDRGYAYNLNELGSRLQGRVVRSDREPARAKVKAMLEARGIAVPERRR